MRPGSGRREKSRRRIPTGSCLGRIGTGGIFEKGRTPFSGIRRLTAGAKTLRRPASPPAYGAFVFFMYSPGQGAGTPPRLFPGRFRPFLSRPQAQADQLYRCLGTGLKLYFLIISLALRAVKRKVLSSVSARICNLVLLPANRGDNVPILFPVLEYYLSVIKFDVHIFIWLFTVRTPQVFLLAGEAGGIKLASAIILLSIFPKLVML